MGFSDFGQHDEPTLFGMDDSGRSRMDDEPVPLDAPLSTRMRPRTLDEFVGQEQILGRGKALRIAIENDRLTSCIFYGPAGSGKTTLAYIIARMTRAHFERFSAVTAGVGDVKRIVGEAKGRRKRFGQKTMLFVDEIHRFNKAQQDAFLPHVEDGTIILIGATTENPFFSINAPLLSRSRIYRFEPLTPEHIHIIIERALRDEERGLGKLALKIEDKALRHLCERSNGDARRALDALELAAIAATRDGRVGATITLPLVEDALQEVAITYDKAGDSHYDTISAFVKSIRGSDPDAALYWLAKMLRAGEDPRFIARRLIIHASEDIGNADPMALLVACAAAQAVEFVGMPEAQLALSQATIYLATAPKSNSCCLAISKAMHDIEERGAMPVPPHLRDASYVGARRLGHGIGYIYPHNYPEHYVPQEYLPEGAKSQPYYTPTVIGFERVIAKRMERWKRLKEAAGKNMDETKADSQQTVSEQSPAAANLAAQEGGMKAMREGVNLNLRDDGIVIVSPNGELDLSTAELLRKRLREATSTAKVGIVVDLSRVTFMDSVTLGILLGAMRRAKENGLRFALASPSEHDKKVMSMTRLDEAFEIHDDIGGAIRSIIGGDSE